MKTSEETLVWLADVIGFIYERPEMYALTLRELDRTLSAYHGMWQFITGQNVIAGAHADLCKGKYRSVISDAVKGSKLIEKPQLSDFKVVLDHWQKVDARIGLKPTKGS